MPARPTCRSAPRTLGRSAGPGTFDLHGRFTFKVSTPHGGLTYKTSVTINGGFSHHGQKVSGTLRETATHNNFSCHSGTVRFSASLTK